MTDGEKMVWAATFSLWLKKNFSFEVTPKGIYASGKEKELEKWRKGQVNSAIEHARSAVDDMRRALPGIIEGWDCDGEEHKVTKMLKEMLGK